MTFLKDRKSGTLVDTSCRTLVSLFLDGYGGLATDAPTEKRQKKMAKYVGWLLSPLPPPLQIASICANLRNLK